MKMIKNSRFFLVSLVVVALCSSLGVVRAENGDQSNINDNQTITNANQANINKNQADINEKQSDVNKNQKNANQEKGNDKGVNGDDHKSVVATLVLNLLDVADKDQEGIGEEIKAVATAQNDSKDNVAKAIDKINNRNAFKTFFIGTDYKSVGQLRSEMVTTGNQIDQLTKLLEKAKNAEDKASLQAQIQVLTQEQQKINDFLKTNENKFSLLGWFVRFFSK